MQTKIYVGTENNEQRRGLLGLLLACGYVENDKYDTVDSIIDDTDHDMYPVVIIRNDVKDIGFTGDNANYNWPEDSVEIIDFIYSAPKAVKLNDEYTALITKEGVKVGCQTIPFSAVAELHRAILTFSEKS